MYELLLKQSEMLEELAELCKKLVNELGQYKAIDEEEKKLELIEEDNAWKH